MRHRSRLDSGSAEPPPARAVGIAELGRRAPEVVRRVERGEIAVITRHGRPCAFVLPLELAVAALDPEVTMTGEMRSLATAFAQRDRERRLSALMHGRWYDGAGLGQG